MLLLLLSQLNRLYWQIYCQEEVGTSTPAFFQLLSHKFPARLPIVLLSHYPGVCVATTTFGSYTPPGSVHLLFRPGSGIQLRGSKLNGRPRVSESLRLRNIPLGSSALTLIHSPALHAPLLPFCLTL